MVTTIYLVRHGESAGNLDGVFQGSTDCGISDNGKIQLAVLKERFAAIPFDCVYSSPLKRAVETAQAIASCLDLPVMREPGLIEINGGVFEGKTWQQLKEQYPDALTVFLNRIHDFSPEGGEAVTAVYARMRDTVTRLVSENLGKRIVLVSHGCAIKNFLCYAGHTPFEALGTIPWPDNTSVSRITYEEGTGFQIQTMADAKHLEGLGLIKPRYWDGSVTVFSEGDA